MRGAVIAKLVTKLVAKSVTKVVNKFFAKSCVGASASDISLKNCFADDKGKIMQGLMRLAHEYEHDFLSNQASVGMSEAANLEGEDDHEDADDKDVACDDPK